MKYLLFFSLLFAVSCSKDSNSTNNSCFFVGKWCLWNTVGNTCYPATVEFRSNGEFIQAGLLGWKWESSDCKTVKLFNKNIPGSNQPVDQLIVTKLSNDVLLLNRGGTDDEYHRL